jgi:hypothetical protein
LRDKEKQKKAQHEWYLNNKEITRKRAVVSKREYKEFFASLKEKEKCEICGESNNPDILIYHHTIPGEKISNVSQMIADGVKKEIVLKEIEKCQILCSNCHKKLHSDGNGSKNATIDRQNYVEMKKSLKCEMCGETHPACLEFHHKDPKTKKFNISDAIRTTHSLEEILEEINKCTLLCSNCHLTQHANNARIVKRPKTLVC